MKQFARFVTSAIFVLRSALVIQAGTPLANHNDVWRYHKGNAGAREVDWKTTVDTNLGPAWLPANGGFGYADNAAEVSLCGTILADMRGNYSTVAMRQSFTVVTNIDPALHLTLTMDWDDGFIAWLDGTYLVSQNSPGAPAEPPADAAATATHESSRGDNSAQPAVTYDMGTVGTRLPPGTHVLAVVGLNSSLSGSGDFVQIADLFLETNAPPASNCISGLILTNTTWRAADSPMEICKDLTVTNGVTLVIEPGVTVYLDAGVNLAVENGGALIAEGNATNRIRFMRAPAAGTTWGGLTINGGPGSPETRIMYADLEGNGSTAIHSNGGAVLLDHLTFGSPDRQYVSLDSSSFIVSDCVFPTGTVNFELAHGTGGIKPGGHGIFLRNYFGGTLGYDDVVDFTGGKRPGPIVHFIDNVFSGSQDDGLDLDGTDAWIEGNIFLHVHRNGNTPDSSAAISGGSYGTDTSRLTIIGNLFFDCDNALTAKQGNFYTFINNTVFHTTKTGGIDFASGVANVRDTTPSPTIFADGCYLEANIIVDAEQLVRNYDPAQTAVTLNENILPLAWSGPGAGNLVADPRLAHVPQLSETFFTNWAQAQILRTWFGLLPDSPAIGSGPNGRDKGGVVPLGAAISGEPENVTPQTDALLHVGVNRSGHGIPVTGWPEGSGYTHYKWRLDGGAWSAETLIADALTLTNLTRGPHYVEVAGKRDSGLYQDDPLFGAAATITRSRTWIVGDFVRVDRISIAGDNTIEIQFTAQANTGYTIQYRDSLFAGNWQPFMHLDPLPATHTNSVAVASPQDTPARFYRIVSP
ncbi:MAG: hypothetical protein HY043_05370 [Verrucomicrobia bacterium]|nr:hypothetical protein [Verrucomicrobiota bacterium]